MFNRDYILFAFIVIFQLITIQVDSVQVKPVYWSIQQLKANFQDFLLGDLMSLANKNSFTSQGEKS